LGYRVGKPRLLRELNTGLLLRLIRERGPLSRPELADLTGLSLPTVNARSRHLLDAGYAREVRRAESHPGRPAMLLEFNAEFRYVAGIDVSGFRVCVVLANLVGELVASESCTLGKPVRGERVLDTAWTLLNRALSRRLLNSHDLGVIGVSTPGLVDPLTGDVSFVPNIPGWSELKPPLRFAELTGRPIVIENDVNAAMEGELWRGAARGARNAVFVTINRGIGAGLLIGGALYRGLHGAAGEIGLQREFHDDEPLKGLFGPLERSASGLGMVRRYAELVGEQAGHLEPQAIFRAAEDGDDSARMVVDEATSLIAGSLVNLCAVLAPELVVLGGSVAGVGETLAGPVRRRLERSLPVPPRVVISELGELATVLGVVRLALERIDREEFAFDGLPKESEDTRERSVST
jgi:predicted NBD/HSP70 family sugar kinase